MWNHGIPNQRLNLIDSCGATGLIWILLEIRGVDKDREKRRGIGRVSTHVILFCKISNKNRAGTREWNQALHELKASFIPFYLLTIVLFVSTCIAFLRWIMRAAAAAPAPAGLNYDEVKLHQILQYCSLENLDNSSFDSRDRRTKKRARNP